MLGNHHHLLTGDKALEARVEGLLSSVDLGSVTVPVDTLGTREQLLHEFLLAAELNIDVAITDARVAAVYAALLEASNSSLSLGDGVKLDVTVHSLASRTFHDDMDGQVRCAARLVSDTSGTTQSSDDLVLGGAIGDVANLDHAGSGGDRVGSSVNERNVLVHFVDAREGVHVNRNPVGVGVHVRGHGSLTTYDMLNSKLIARSVTGTARRRSATEVIKCARFDGLSHTSSVGLRLLIVIGRGVGVLSIGGVEVASAIHAAGAADGRGQRRARVRGEGLTARLSGHEAGVGIAGRLGIHEGIGLISGRRHSTGDGHRAVHLVAVRLLTVHIAAVHVLTVHVLTVHLLAVHLLTVHLVVVEVTRVHLRTIHLEAVGEVATSIETVHLAAIHVSEAGRNGNTIERGAAVSARASIVVHAVHRSHARHERGVEGAMHVDRRLQASETRSNNVLVVKGGAVHVDRRLQTSETRIDVRVANGGALIEGRVLLRVLEVLLHVTHVLLADGVLADGWGRLGAVVHGSRSRKLTESVRSSEVVGSRSVNVLTKTIWALLSLVET